MAALKDGSDDIRGKPGELHKAPEAMAALPSILGNLTDRSIRRGKHRLARLTSFPQETDQLRVGLKLDPVSAMEDKLDCLTLANLGCWSIDAKVTISRCRIRQEPPQQCWPIQCDAHAVLTYLNLADDGVDVGATRENLIDPTREHFGPRDRSGKRRSVNLVTDEAAKLTTIAQ